MSVIKMDGNWNVYKIYENEMLILLISIQKLYFCYDDAIYDVIMHRK